jgi:hypothetical protein
LPWPELDDASAVTLLRTLRTAAGHRSAEPAVHITLPVPGDVRGLPAGTGFARDALAAGEALVVAGDRGSAIGLVPEFDYADDESNLDDEVRALVWTVYSLPAAPPTAHVGLGEAEYALRSAVRSAAEALTAIRPGVNVSDPRSRVEQVLESAHQHRVPDGAPPRAVRVLENAAHIDAIIAVSSEFASAELRPLAAVVRSARMAAVTAILHSAWR